MSKVESNSAENVKFNVCNYRTKFQNCRNDLIAQLISRMFFDLHRLVV